MMRRLRWLLLAVAPLALGIPVAGTLAQDDAVAPGQLASRDVPKDVPFVPTPEDVVEEMLRLARIGKKDVLYDLGSGDGRIVVTAAKRYGARGIGVDIDPERIAEGNENARKAGVTQRVKFIQGDLFKVDLREATAVTLYLLPSVNLRLRPKLLAELAPGTPVVSHSFDMEDWEPDTKSEVDGKTIYAWIVPASVAGRWEVTVKGAPGSSRYRLDLAQRFQRVKGAADVGGKTVPLRTCQLSGREISFTFTEVVDGVPVLRQFRGEVDGDRMTGEPGQLSWSARRAAS